MPRAKNQSARVRYAVVGLGHIAQNAILPAFKHATKNSELTALVSGTPRKLEQLGRIYRVPNRYSYKQYDACLRSGQVDAVFIALPNDMHRDFAIRAARAGIHVLCEKPLGVSVADCADIAKAASSHKIRLMTAYRLHFEETNLRAIELIQSGKIGEPRYFNSTFSFQVTDPDNIRLIKKRGGGVVYDIGIYCINAARYLFRAEPEAVTAMTVAPKGDRRFREVEETCSAILRFPGNRLASFTASFGAGDAAAYEVVGTKGSLRVDPAYEYQGQLAYTLKVGEKEQEKIFAARDQFAAELDYFSDCVLNRRDPEPDACEGLADLRIIEAIYQSAKSGKTIRLGKFQKRRRPTLDQERKFPPVKNPPKVKVEAPHDE